MKLFWVDRNEINGLHSYPKLFLLFCFNMYMQGKETSEPDYEVCFRSNSCPPPQNVHFFACSNEEFVVGDTAVFMEIYPFSSHMHFDMCSLLQGR